jgi:hypothetical protein
LIDEGLNKGQFKMQTQTIDLTKWLDLVWKALSEQDKVKRGQLLYAAETLLREDNQELDSAQPAEQLRRMAA